MELRPASQVDRNKVLDRGARRGKSDMHERREFERPLGARGRAERQGRSVRAVLESPVSLRGRRETTLRGLLRAESRRSTASSGARTPPAWQRVPRIRPPVSGRHELRLVLSSTRGLRPVEISPGLPPVSSSPRTTAIAVIPVPCQRFRNAIVYHVELTPKRWEAMRYRQVADSSDRLVHLTP